MIMVEYGLPVALLLLVFLLRLFVDRSVSVPDLIVSLLEFPTSIIFLGLSFVLAFTISSKENLGMAIVTVIIYLIVALLVIFLGRRAVRYFEVNRLFLMGSLGFISYIMCVPALFYSIRIVVS